MEKTLVILKPDAVRRKFIGEIISRIERKSFVIVQMKVVNISYEIAEKHYEHIKTRPFFEDMLKYITSGPCVAMVIEGEKVIQAIRNLMGKTDPLEALPGTIRGDLGAPGFENLIHASDSQESVAIEIQRFFPEI